MAWNSGISSTSIEYIIFYNGSSIQAAFIPPEFLTYGIVSFIKYLPKDLIQLHDSMKYYEMNLRSAMNLGYNIQIWNIADFNLFMDIILKSPKVQLLFFDGGDQNHQMIFKQIEAVSGASTFFHFYNKFFSNSSDKVVQKPIDFLSKLLSLESEISDSYIKSQLSNSFIKFNYEVDLLYKDLAEFDFFVPIQNNGFVANNIIGNFGIFNGLNEEEILEKNVQESVSANFQKHSFSRQDRFVKSLDNVDFFSKVALLEDLIIRSSNVEPLFAPLILIAPYHNPDIVKKGDVISYGMGLEQSRNYIVEGDGQKIDALTMHFSMKLHKDRLNYLDDLGFLHSSFTFSPVLRLPLVGKSINRELSFFAPNTFQYYTKKTSRIKIKKSIEKLGKVVTNRVLSPKIQKAICKRNSQIVAISDLPIEWMNIDDIPLCFTHDVCRLPETSLHGLLSLYEAQVPFRYSVPEDIMSRTLVIFGAYESTFVKWHSFIESEQLKLGFKIAGCKTINEVEEAIEKYKPEFLIFDCHGGFDATTNSTFLYIGNEILTGHDVIRRNIVAPLVFLSACGTAPTYGTMNPIANAFFEAGALAVTSTFLPISVDGGSVLYIRLLGKLAYASTMPVHKNWLEFVCHIIRTSTINEAFMYSLEQKIVANKEEFIDTHTKTLIESLRFEKRRSLYHNLDDIISEMSKVKRDHYSRLVPEYLLYTTLGRADLIQFEVWQEDNKSINLPEG